jgi:hypothetical protein
MTAGWLLTFAVILVGDILLDWISAAWELAFLAGAGSASALIVRLAWRREALCAPLLLAWGVEFAIVAGWMAPLQSRVAAGLVAGAPFVAAGLLVLASQWWLRQARVIQI